MTLRLRAARAGERGLSLIELLVGIAVFALLFLMVDSVFITAHRGARKAELGANVQQNGRIAIERLTREIRETDKSDIRVAVDGSWVAFKSARLATDGQVFCINVNDPTSPLYRAACNPTGNTFAPIWQTWIVYTYNAGTDELLREVQSPLSADPTVPGVGDVVAASVQSFDARCSPAAPGMFCVNLEVLGREVVQGSQVPPEQITLTSRVEIRN
jgi:prepilin-type N-terminal cleavage/methylation domain-containing protein